MYVSITLYGTLLLSLIQYFSWGLATTIQDVSFILFTPQNPSSGELLKINDTEALEKSNFNKDWPVRFIIHGWRASKDSRLNIIIRDAYLKKGNFNVIVVDWSKYSNEIYLIAYTKVEPVGSVVALFTEFLEEQGVPFDSMYLIGHSLGAHISGIAGYKIAPGQYNTIFALDPARPEFDWAPLSSRVDPSDAKYVESIQTDAYLIGVGLMIPAGQASFFPNEFLLAQPGCETISCSHSRSIEYFAESINSDVGFLAKVCPICTDYVSMGGEPSTPKSGIFNMPTNSKAPYAMGKLQ